MDLVPINVLIVLDPILVILVPEMQISTITVIVKMMKLELESTVKNVTKNVKPVSEILKLVKAVLIPIEFLKKDVDVKMDILMDLMDLLVFPVPTVTVKDVINM